MFTFFKIILRPHALALHTGQVVLLGLILLFGLGLAGCRWGAPAPAASPTPQQIVSAGTPGSEAASPAAPGEKALPGSPSASPAVGAGGGTPYPPGAAAAATTQLAATPTVCQPPPGWVVYTILPGDTFFSLALLTNTSVETLLQANCKQDPLLIAYETIYLPKRPPAPTLPPVRAGDGGASDGGAGDGGAGSIATSDACASIFTCANPSLQAFSIVPGGGNDPTFRPCDDGQSGPRITYEGLQKPIPETNKEIGQQLYFFACDFSQADTLSAEIIGPNGRTVLDILEINELPNPDLIANSAQAQKVIPFYPVCDLAPGDYTLVVQDSSDMATQLVTLNTPRFQRILVKPQSVQGGETFEIFYCNYTAQANQVVSINLYYNSGTLPSGERRFGHFRQFDVRIGPDGWARQTQTAPIGASTLYYLNDVSGELEGEDFFWIWP